jgi:broad specificity phosphatase PhoE
MIFLQRHGESDANVSGIYACRELDPDLTEQGLKEAQASVPFFAKVGIRKILTSPSRRSIQTAKAINANLRCDIEINNLLMEVDVGDFEGQSFHSEMFSSERFFGIFHEWLVENKDSRFPGGESRKEVEGRVRKLEKTIFSFPTILVGHAALFAFFLGQRKRFDDVRELFLPNCGIAYYSESMQDWIIKNEVEQNAAPEFHSAGA